MKNNRKGLLIAVMFAVSVTAHAQMTLTGEIRPRTEYRHGYKSLIDTNQSGSVFTEQRTRLNFGYAGEKYKTGIVVQDVRVWGGQTQLIKSDGLNAIHEAWGEYSFTKNISLKAGRQEISYDDERLFGAVGWTQQARSHDLLLLKYEDSTFFIHAGFAYNQNANSDAVLTGTVYSVAAPTYKEMQYLWLNKKIGKLNASLYAVNTSSQSPVMVNSSYNMQTFGPYLEYKTDKLGVSGKFFYQIGEDSKKKEVGAYYAGADVNYKISKFTAGIGFELLSGHSQTDTTKAYAKENHSFNPLYGTGHKFNGYMDYFYVGNHLNTVGLMNPYLKLKYKAEKWMVGLDVHMFQAANEVLDKAELTKNNVYKAMDSGLGTEIDLTFNYNFTKQVGLQLGYSQMLATETLKALKGGSDSETQNWAYLMLTFKPNFLK